jgi:hypothetical protein
MNPTWSTVIIGGLLLLLAAFNKKSIGVLKLPPRVIVMALGVAFILAGLFWKV